MSVTVGNSAANLSGDTLVTAENAETLTGLKTFDRDPSAPFAVSSGSAKVDNLDADMVDGLHAADLGGADPAGTESITGVWTFSTNPVFNANAIPETAIADGSVYPRIAADETITGTWTFSNGIKLPPVAGLDGKLPSMIYQSNTSIGNVGTGEDDLWSQTIAASVLGADNEKLIIEIWGTGSANANSKTVKIYWNGVAVYTSPTETTQADDWYCKMMVGRRGATSQIINGIFCGWGSTDIADAFSATGSATLSSTVVVKATGTGVSNNDITTEQALITWVPAL